MLYKLAELAHNNKAHLYQLKGLGSWKALESSMQWKIGNRLLSPYQIKYQVVKNINKLEASPYAVDGEFLHPLIEYAFFMPIHGRLRLESVIFTEAEDFVNVPGSVFNRSMK